MLPLPYSLWHTIVTTNRNRFWGDPRDRGSGYDLERGSEPKRQYNEKRFLLKFSSKLFSCSLLNSGNLEILFSNPRGSVFEKRASNHVLGEGIGTRKTHERFETWMLGKVVEDNDDTGRRDGFWNDLCLFIGERVWQGCHEI